MDTWRSLLLSPVSLKCFLHRNRVTPLRSGTFCEQTVVRKYSGACVIMGVHDENLRGMDSRRPQTQGHRSCGGKKMAKVWEL